MPANTATLATKFDQLAAEEFGHTRIHWGLITPQNLQFAQENCATEDEIVDELLSLFAHPLNY